MTIYVTAVDVAKSDAGSDSGPSVDFKPGRHNCEVKEVRDGNKPGQYGICFKEVKSGAIICWDNLTFHGKALGIAVKKAKMIDPEFKTDEDYDEQDFVGRRVTLELDNETFNGKTRLSPKFKAENFGYVESDVPC